MKTNTYQIFVEKFTPSKTLKGVENELDYLQDLGVKTVWLMLIFEAMDDHGYNATNYKEIDPRYGTLQDLKDLVNEAHKKDMKIILDLVINHTGTKHSWFCDSNQTIRKDHWYIWAPYDRNWDDPWNDNPPNPDPIHANKTWFKDPFYWYDRDGDGDPNNDDYYYSVFGNGDAKITDPIVGYGSTMPDLNYNEANAAQEIISEFKEIMKYWIKNTGIDGYRCDVCATSMNMALEIKQIRIKLMRSGKNLEKN